MIFTKDNFEKKSELKYAFWGWDEEKREFYAQVTDRKTGEIKFMLFPFVYARSFAKFVFRILGGYVISGIRWRNRKRG